MRAQSAVNLLIYESLSSPLDSKLSGGNFSYRMVQKRPKLLGTSSVGIAVLRTQCTND